MLHVMFSATLFFSSLLSVSIIVGMLGMQCADSSSYALQLLMWTSKPIYKVEDGTKRMY